MQLFKTYILAVKTTFFVLNTLYSPPSGGGARLSRRRGEGEKERTPCRNLLLGHLRGGKISFFFWPPCCFPRPPPGRVRPRAKRLKACEMATTRKSSRTGLRRSFMYYTILLHTYVFFLLRGLFIGILNILVVQDM